MERDGALVGRLSHSQKKKKSAVKPPQDATSEAVCAAVTGSTRFNSFSDYCTSSLSRLSTGRSVLNAGQVLVFTHIAESNKKHLKAKNIPLLS